MLRFKYLIFLLISHSLYALTTLEVTLNSDNNPGGNGEAGDLRFSLNLMNENLNTLPDDHAIVFASPMTIQLNGILPIINNSPNPVNITIGNPGSTPSVIIDGNNGAYNGFFIPSGNVTIQNMIFQNLSAKGGNGGNGISGGGGGMGAGGAIYAPQSFLNGSYPSITLVNVAINNCSAVGGNGGSYITFPATGNEGGGGGGGFSGNGGSVTSSGSTGGAGGGGFGGNGGDATLSFDLNGGGGGGGGGLGSRASIGILLNLGDGGSDQTNGMDGNGYGLTNSAGSGAGGYSGGSRLGGGGGGGPQEAMLPFGGGGGGSIGSDGTQPQGSIPPGGSVMPSGGNGGDGGGGGGGGIVSVIINNDIDGQAGSGGYGGGGGGGAGSGASDADYSVQGGSGGIGGGGGGGGNGGSNQSGQMPSEGGNSLAGGGGGGGGPSNGPLTASGGIDIGNLGGGAGGYGADNLGTGYGGGGGGGGSGLGGAIFVDSNLNFTIQALSGIPTTFNTLSNLVQGGIHGTCGLGGSDGADGLALGNSIFMRSGSSLIFIANNADDLLILGEGVSFVDDTSFGAGGTMVSVQGNGTIIYNGTTQYEGNILINNANFKVNGLIENAPVAVCRNIGFSSQRGMLSGMGTLSGHVFVNSGTISPDPGEILTLGSLTLNPADLINDTLGSLVHIEIDSNGTSLVSVNGPASLAGTLEITLNPSVTQGTYTILSSSAIAGTFDFLTFTGSAPNYTLSYLPIGNPTFVQLEILAPPPSNILPPSNLQGKQKKNDFGLEYELYNQLVWMPSPSSEIAGYFIYRDGKKIATVGAATHTYQDHNRKKKTAYSYAITAFNSAGNESTPVNIIITP